MKALDRNRIDQLVRELETDAYRQALTAGPDRAAAERILVAAFASLAPSLPVTPQIVELKERLQRRIHRLASPGRGSTVQADQPVDQGVVVSESLHLQIVDLLEEQQGVEPVGRRRAMLLGLAGVVAVGALGAYLWFRVDALAAAQPTVLGVSPAAGSREVPLRGDFKVTFNSHPVGTPTLRLEPADGIMAPPMWDGSTLVVSYSGLRLATNYQVVLGADYRSRFKDIGHLVKRWSFSAEGYPILVRLGPADGQSNVTRIGTIAIDFNHRPPVDPQLVIEPPAGSLLPGNWSGSTWTVGYTGLKPVTTYQVTAVVDYGVRAANIRRQWAFTTEPGAPAAGTSVIWYSTVSPYGGPVSEQRLVALDWTGTIVGTMYQSPPIVQSPDGTILANQEGMYFDRTGATLKTGSTSVYYTSALADDNRSLCETRPSGAVVGEQSVFIGRVGGPARRVAQAGVTADRTTIAILACSVLNDRVVVGDLGTRGLTSVRVLAITSGRLLYQHAYSAQSTSVIGSHDGRYLAEQAVNYDGQGQPVVGETLIRRTVDGQIVGRVGKLRVVRFSWDGMRVVTGPLFAGTGDDVELIDWQTGKALWRQASGGDSNGGAIVLAMAQPSGPSMAIAIGTHAGPSSVDQLWLVDAVGHATLAINEVFYPAFPIGF